MSNPSRDWITENNRLSLQYKTGVNEFIRLASRLPNENGQYRCPCKSCNNVKKHYETVCASSLNLHIWQPGICTGLCGCQMREVMDTDQSQTEFYPPPYHDLISYSQTVIHRKLWTYLPLSGRMDILYSTLPRIME